MNLRLPTRDEVHRAFLQGEEAIVERFAEVGEQIEASPSGSHNVYTRWKRRRRRSKTCKPT
ncbi:MAG: hypothetical protein WAN46_19945 [Gammaproteobacteria bacterium]